MKLFEYLGTGKPIVATYTDSLKIFEEFVFLSRSYSEFLKGVEYYLKNDNDHKKNKRLTLAQNNDWSKRFAVLEKGLIEHKNFMGVEYIK